MLRVMGRRMMGTTGGQRASGVISGVGAVLVSTAAAVGIPMDGAWHTVIESTGGGPVSYTPLTLPTTYPGSFPVPPT